MSVEIIDAITGLHRKCNFAMEQRKRSNLALGSFLRLALGWRKDLPEAERKSIAAEAAAYMTSGEGPFADIIAAADLARAPYEKIERDCVRQMEKLATKLPAWSFVESISGFGKKSFAIIIAEAGDLANYPTKSKLWKRMGVAVMDGVRQGGLAKNAKAEDWIAHGYNRQRRSRMWNVGESLIKAQVRQVKDADGKDSGERMAIGKYGELYLSRKSFEIARDPEMSKLHAHRRAQRYMEKRLLQDLWRAWRQTDHSLANRPEDPMSVATSIQPGAA